MASEYDATANVRKDLQTPLDRLAEAIVVRAGQLPGQRKSVVPLVPVVSR